MKTSKISYQDFTELPLREIIKGDSVGFALEVQTPMGQEILDYNKIHYPFLFGSTTSVDKPATQIIAKLNRLERDSKDYLLNKWKESLTPDTK